MPGSHAQCHAAFVPAPDQVSKPHQDQVGGIERVLHGRVITGSGQHRQSCCQHEKCDDYDAIVEHNQQAADQAAGGSVFFLIAV